MNMLYEVTVSCHESSYMAAKSEKEAKDQEYQMYSFLVRYGKEFFSSWGETKDKHLSC